MIEKTMEVDRMEDVISVFGSFDQNLRMIETEYNVRVTDRDEQIHITGEAENVLYAEKAIAGLLSLAAKGEEIGEQNVRYIFRLVREGREQKIQELAGDVVCITAKGKPIKAKTLGQRAYLDAIEQNTITLGVGPAGTGKTYLAVAEAVAAFRAERVNRIILTRPAVEAGERLGFLPGDLQNKVDPYLRPLYDALFEMLGADAYAKYLERGNIEVAPLAYMRGRTLDDSFIILDEAQNTTREQMKMFLTRLGFGSKIVITGDVVDGSPSRLEEDVAPLADLKAKYGVIFAPGNHEYYSGIQQWLPVFQRLGMHVLMNENTQIRVNGTPLAIAGVTDTAALNWGLEGPDPEKALSGLSKDITKLMLSHRPSLAPESAKAGASLQLSGHTHGGLILPVTPLIAAFNGGYVSGPYTVDGMPLYVSSGSGLWGGIPLRLFVPSEITLITLTGTGFDTN